MTNPGFTIAKMTAQDIEPAIHILSKSWLDTYVNDDLGVTREWIEDRNRDRLSPEKIKLWYEKLDNPNTAGWVTKDESGTAVGMTTPYRDGAGMQHVGSLYVDKDWHGKGVGGALIQKVIEWFDPALPIELGVATYNTRAQAFYEKWGFRKVADLHRMFAGVIPEVIMRRSGVKRDRK